MSGSQKAHISYVKLLSVHLFSLMDDGEKLLATGGKTFRLSKALRFRIDQAYEWTHRLAKFDEEFSRFKVDLPSEDQPSSSVDRNYLEKLMNSIAVTLMQLEEHFGIFTEGMPDDEFESNAYSMPPFIVESENYSDFVDPVTSN